MKTDSILYLFFAKSFFLQTCTIVCYMSAQVRDEEVQMVLGCADAACNSTQGIARAVAAAAEADIVLV